MGLDLLRTEFDVILKSLKFQPYTGSRGPAWIGNDEYDSLSWVTISRLFLMLDKLFFGISLDFDRV